MRILLIIVYSPIIAEGFGFSRSNASTKSFEASSMNSL